MNSADEGSGRQAQKEQVLARNGIFPKLSNYLPMRFAKLLRDKSLKAYINGKAVSNILKNESK